MVVDSVDSFLQNLDVDPAPKSKWVVRTQMKWQDGDTTYETVEISDELVKAIHTHVADQLIARCAGKIAEEDRGYMYRRMNAFEVFRSF